jgi:hypothetical protein
MLFADRLPSAQVGKRSGGDADHHNIGAGEALRKLPTASAKSDQRARKPLTYALASAA